MGAAQQEGQSMSHFLSTNYFTSHPQATLPVPALHSEIFLSLQKGLTFHAYCLLTISLLD